MSPSERLPQPWHSPAAAGDSPDTAHAAAAGQRVGDEQAELARWIEGLSESESSRLLRRRPDAATPPPPDASSLAARLRITGSIRRAVLGLSAPEVAAAEAYARLGATLRPVSDSDVLGAVSSRGLRDSVARGMAGLREAGLVFGVEGRFRLVGQVVRHLPGEFSVLDEAAYEESESLPSTEQIRARVAGLDPRTRAILETAIRAGGLSLNRSDSPGASPSTSASKPVGSLLDAGLVMRVDNYSVRVPRIVSDAVRGRSHVRIPLQVPAPGGDEPGDSSEGPRRGAAPPADDRAAAGQGLEAVRLMSALVTALGHTPGALIRSGGLAVRELRHLQTELAADAETVTRLIGLGLAADLLACGYPDNPDGESDTASAQVLAPTPLADDWLQAPLAGRWATLVSAWLDSTLSAARLTRSQPGAASAPNSSKIHLLEEASHDSALPRARQVLLGPLLHLPEGDRLTPRELAEAAAFAHPLLLLRLEEDTLVEALASARLLGLVAGAGEYRLSPVGQAALHRSLPDIQAATAGLAPDEVAAVIVQSDMTVLAPGPLPFELSSLLERFADLESPGLAASYRISGDSMRRGLETGLSAADIHGFLNAHALGEVPQTVRVLIDDVARAHGGLRGGPAGCYLRCEDDELRQLMESPVAARAGLRSLAPTVAVSPLPLARVVAEVADAGFHAVAEDADGRSVDISAPPTRVTKAKKRKRVQQPAAATGGSHEEQLLAALGAAARARQTVVLRVADSSGAAKELRVRPLRVEGGQIYAVDDRTESVLRFGVHRVIAVRAVRDDGA